MNIKSLLIGSAAVLVAVSGARAADAVVAEPEAVEYVRVCDAYGAGYFYIPGTETCLKIGGWVRYQINYKNTDEGFTKLARGRIEFTSKNESDLGDVTGWIRLDSRETSTNPAATAVVDFGSTASESNQYMISVGGLEMGFRDSQWERFSKNGGLTDDGANYGKQERHYISYTFTGEGFSAILSLDHDNSANYVPDVMAGVSGKFGDMSASLSAGYDESMRDGALKATADFAVGEAKLRVIGQYATGRNSYWYATSAGLNAESNAFGVIAGISAPIGEKLSIAADIGYDKASGGKGTVQAIGDVNYTIASGLKALFEVKYSKTTGSDAKTTGFLRFQRSF